MDPARTERARDRSWLLLLLLLALLGVCAAAPLLPWLPCPSCEWRTIRVPQGIGKGQAIPVPVPWSARGRTACDVCKEKRRVSYFQGRSWRPPEPFSATPSDRAR